VQSTSNKIEAPLAVIPNWAFSIHLYLISMLSILSWLFNDAENIDAA
jgi:hypothetical protein